MIKDPKYATGYNIICSLYIFDIFLIYFSNTTVLGSEDTCILLKCYGTIAVFTVSDNSSEARRSILYLATYSSGGKT